MRQRILHIPNFYFPHVGGIEDACKTIVGIVSKHDVAEQEVICFSGSRKSSEGKVEGVKVRYVGGFVQVASQWLSLRYYFSLRKAIRQFQPTVIHFHAPNPLVAFYLLALIPKEVRLIVHWHADVVKQKMLYHIVKPIEKRLIERADVILTTSPIYAKKSKALQPYLEKVQVLANVISEDVMNMTKEEERLAEKIVNEHDHLPIVFFIGRHVPYKGLKYLIEAERFIKSECVIAIAGDGPLTSCLKKQSEGRKRLVFLGRISNEEKKAYYRACSIFAFPSVTKNEAFGLALAEAMYYGKPAVTFHIDGSGVNYVNEKGITGEEVVNGDVRAYASAIDGLLEDKLKCQRMGEAACERVMRNFTVGAIEKQVKELYADELKVKESWK